jgi:hypothetical protein
MQISTKTGVVQDIVVLSSLRSGNEILADEQGRASKSGATFVPLAFLGLACLFAHVGQF